jgi:hypothetical protein
MTVHDQCTTEGGRWVREEGQLRCVCAQAKERLEVRKGGGAFVVVCGLWFVGLWVCGLWVVGCDLWFVVCGLRYRVHPDRRNPPATCALCCSE